VRPHLNTTGIAPPFNLPGPFYIPYRSLASNNVRNLLTAGKTIAQTYVTNSAYRLHPIEWSSGTAAGTAAALMARDGLDNRGLLTIARLRPYQQAVAAQGPIRWAYRNEPVIPPHDGDLVVNGFRAITLLTPYVVEVYHPTAVRAEVLVNGTLLGETTTRRLGRLHYTAPGLTDTTDPALYTVRCYDAEGNLLATLTASMPLAGVPCELEPGVSDNDDPTVYTRTSGWTRSSAQADRWCNGTYDLKFGNSPAVSATWQLRTTVPGRYTVDVWYSASSNRTTNAPFTVHHRDGSTLVRVNQTINGGRWVNLGTFAFVQAAGERVVLTNNDVPDSSKLVTGDAVRVRLVEPFEPRTPAMWVVR
jgi:hypothetical protein